MGRSERTAKFDNSVEEIWAEFAGSDPRLARRWKRRFSANQYFSAKRRRVHRDVDDEPVADVGDAPVAVDVGDEPAAVDVGDEPAVDVGYEPVAADVGYEPAADVGYEPVAADVGEEPVAADVGDEPVAAVFGKEPVAADVGEEPVAADVGDGSVAVVGLEPVADVAEGPVADVVEVGDDSVVNVGVAEVDDDYEDPHYMMFLENMNDGAAADDATDVSDNEVAVASDVVDASDDEDPVYKMFLQNLRASGNSYALEVRVNGVRRLIRYDEDDDWLQGEEGIDFQMPPIETPPANERRKAKPSLCRASREITEPSSREYSSREDIQCSRTSSYQVRNETRGIQETSGGVTSIGKNGSLARGSFNMEHLDPDSAGTNRGSNIRPGGVVHLVESEDECDEIDASYQNFLNGLQLHGEIVYIGESGTPVRYDIEEESGSEDSQSGSTIIAMDNDPYLDFNSPFVPSRAFGGSIDVDGNSCAKNPSTTQSRFRKDLMDLLKKPYDKNEYDSLLEEVYCQKPIYRERSLRSGVLKSYPLENTYAKSYLEQFSDFKAKLELAEHDSHKTLNLLRGFFYWLENIVQEGVFKPWMDPSCMETVAAGQV